MITIWLLIAVAGLPGRRGARVALVRARRRTPRLEERGWLLERERESAARTAVDAERARIAHELHDIVSHNVSVMVVQAGAAREVLATEPDEAEAALLAVEAAGRDTMTELRHLLGLLAPRPMAKRTSELAPQPSLSRLSPLIDRIAFAGLPVEVRISGEPRPLPTGVDVTAYRIIQEALTNALKHGDGAKAEVTVRYADHALRVEVLNTGPSVLTGGRPTGRAGGDGARTARPAAAGGRLRRRPRRPPPPRRRVPGPRPDPAGAPVTSALRVVIADDQALVRTGFRMILTARGIDVVGEAADGAEAVDAVRRLRPDVVLMDIRMPTMDGLEATRRILAEPTDCRVLMLTTFDLDRYVYAALAAGASGFLLKDVTPEHLAAAVRLVNTGDALLAPSITRRLVERFADARPRPSPRSTATSPR